MGLKNYIVKICFFVILFFVVLTFFLGKSVKEKNETISILKSNEKAIIADNNTLSVSNRAYTLKVEELSYYNDSILNIMDSIRKELKIKDSKLEKLQYIKSVITKKDTIIFKDTIFVDNLNIDTIISDNWYSTKLSLVYPSEICIEPTFKSEKIIIVNSKKETINKPRKFFLFRWFQKKHIVTEVNIIEQNPYIDIKEQKYINIIK